MTIKNTLHNLQLNNTLVILHNCGTPYYKRLFATIAAGYTTIDFSLPDIRLQLEQDPELFINSLKLPAYLNNLQYVPELLSHLLRSKLPLGQVLASCSQSYHLEEVAAAEESDRCAFVWTVLSIHKFECPVPLCRKRRGLLCRSQEVLSEPRLRIKSKE